MSRMYHASILFLLVKHPHMTCLPPLNNDAGAMREPCTLTVFFFFLFISGPQLLQGVHHTFAAEEITGAVAARGAERIDDVSPGHTGKEVAAEPSRSGSPGSPIEEGGLVPRRTRRVVGGPNWIKRQRQKNDMYIICNS
jgi:hypothetical protein